MAHQALAAGPPPGPAAAPSASPPVGADGAPSAHTADSRTRAATRTRRPTNRAETAPHRLAEGLPTVIGLDLSVAGTGIAHTDGSTETIKTDPAHGDWRLVLIRRRISEIVAEHPILVVIEDVPPIRGYALAAIGMVHGAVRTLLIRLGVPYALVTPGGAKKYATGRGGATKPDMRMALFQRAGLDLRDENQVDAWWLRAMGLDHLGHPPVAMPAAHREALDKVAWPEVKRFDKFTWPEGDR